VVTFRHGWNPTPRELPRPRFDAALLAVAPPPSVDFYSAVPAVGLHLNDQWGCCTCAGDANIIQGVTAYGQGTETVVPDSAVLQAYEQSGFNPAAGPPGRNPTDQGWLITDALQFLKYTGMAGHRIAAYGQLGALGNHNAVMVCSAEFGYLSLGIYLPASAMDQFNAGHAWDVVARDGGILGGHCICMCGYNATGPVAWTWGKAQQLTWAFWDTYVSEAWPVVSHDWVSAASGKDPEGVDLVTLGAEFQSSVGQNPFPAGSVTPPSPYPAPLPAPVQPPPPAPPALVQGPGCLAGRVVSRLLGRRYSD
jgi:hypothetical protein